VTPAPGGSTGVAEGGLGAALRAIRVARGYSLAQVAVATGISRSLLSLIEIGRSDVTVGRLARLAELYGVSLVELLPAPPSVDPVVTRRDERPKLHSESEGLDLHLLTREAGGTMTPVVAVFEPGGGEAEFHRHDGEQFVLVFEGRVRLELEGSEPVELGRGDSAYYDAHRPARWTNVGRGIARVVAVSGPPASTRA
jgi:transcriptional regulator with XRE-family HTH domain